MTVNLTVISVQITDSQSHAEQMEISSGSLYASEQAWSVPGGIYYVYTTSERGLAVFRHLFIACFFRFHRSHMQCVSIPAAPVWLLVSILTSLPLSHSRRPAYFSPKLHLMPWVEMKHPPLSCELHKHKSEEDKDRIPGGAANIAAATHIAHITTHGCRSVLPVEQADFGETGVLLRIQNVSSFSRC